MCGSCGVSHSKRRAAWFWGVIAVGAVVAAIGLIARPSSTTAAARSAGPCAAARAAYSAFGKDLTTGLAAGNAAGKAEALQATLTFGHATRTSRCTELPGMRRQAMVEIREFCSPCARALAGSQPGV